MIMTRHLKVDSCSTRVIFLLCYVMLSTNPLERSEWPSNNWHRINKLKERTFYLAHLKLLWKEKKKILLSDCHSRLLGLRWWTHRYGATFMDGQDKRCGLTEQESNACKTSTSDTSCLSLGPGPASFGFTAGRSLRQGSNCSLWQEL